MGDLQRGRLNNTTLARLDSHQLLIREGRTTSAGFSAGCSRRARRTRRDLAQYCDRSIWRPDWKDNASG